MVFRPACHQYSEQGLWNRDRNVARSLRFLWALILVYNESGAEVPRDSVQGDSMAHLAISCLGPLQVSLDGRPAENFKSAKVRALLVYLAVEADRPHRRERLAGLLWPDYPDRDALANLRSALSNLRRVIGDRTAEPSFLLVTREILQFNLASDHALDAAPFIARHGTLDSRLQTESVVGSEIEEAVALYHGEFLEGFSISGSAAFEEWVLFRREGIANSVQATLRRLARACETQQEYARALQYARQQVSIEPWREESHRQVMRLLMLDGQRSAALSQYQTCRRLLNAELGVEPTAETIELYEQIRDGELQAADRATPTPDLAGLELPVFLTGPEPVESYKSVFVTRENELAQLDHHLVLALAGQGRVVFVVGDAGSGKTTLTHEFCRRAMDVHPDLIVAGGNCNAHTGVGDPYLPFREILALISGEVEALWSAGSITRRHALRLWENLPLAAQALVDAGPDMVNTFVPGSALIERVLLSMPGDTEWLSRLRDLVEHHKVRTASPSPQQSDLFRQYARVLQVLAKRTPIVLVVDDLQWADLGSISLLFHLGRNLAGCRILVVGAYRPEEVALGRAGERHPLGRIVSEFQRDFGDIMVDLSQTDRGRFVDELIDSEPNRLGSDFRQTLLRQTNGHPLFTVELMRGMQERGDLVQDTAGRWVEGSSLEWEALPARVVAVIAERIDRLAGPLHAVLRVASVEGEVFTAEVAARILAAGEREILELLSNVIDRKHRLIRAYSITRVDGQRLSRFRFRHILYQRYLYGDLGEVERVYLHEQVATVLENLHELQDETLASLPLAIQLAHHFQGARIAEKALHYLHQAGDKAVQLSAYQEGIAHLKGSFDLLMSQPEVPQRARKELDLQLSLGLAWTGIKGTSSEEVFQTLTRARELCQKLGEKHQLCRVLGGLSIFYYVRVQYHQAKSHAKECLILAEQLGDPLLVMLGDWCLGVVTFYMGQFETARAHLERVVASYEPDRHHLSFLALRGMDPGPSSLAYLACCLWSLGYPDRAQQVSRDALTMARALGHPFSLADVVCYAGCLHSAMRRDVGALKETADELIRLSAESVPVWSATSTGFLGQAMVMLGGVEEGADLIRAGIESSMAKDILLNLSGTLSALAQAQAEEGSPIESQRTLAEAQAFVEETGERHWEAELHRLQGMNLLALGDEDAAKASFHQAIAIAREQRARSWELRATTSLCRLWQEQGNIRQARQLLGEIYDWFSEGHDTVDLREAKALLDELV